MSMNLVMIDESKLEQIINSLNTITSHLTKENEKEWYKPIELVEKVNVGYQTIMSKIHSGDLPAKNVGTKKIPRYMIHRDVVNKIMSES